MRLKNIIPLLTACVLSFALHSCAEDREETLLRDLTDGYWLQEEAPDQPLMRFSGSEQLFYYIHSAPDATGRYDACYDTSIQPYTKYAIDFRNGRLCLFPDRWYDILVLDASTLSLGDDEGGYVKFIKIPAGSVTVLTLEEYRDRHPEAVSGS